MSFTTGLFVFNLASAAAKGDGDGGLWLRQQRSLLTARQMSPTYGHCATPLNLCAAIHRATQRAPVSSLLSLDRELLLLSVVATTERV